MEILRDMGRELCSLGMWGSLAAIAAILTVAAFVVP